MARERETAEDALRRIAAIASGAPLEHAAPAAPPAPAPSSPSPPAKPRPRRRAPDAGAPRVEPRIAVAYCASSASARCTQCLRRGRECVCRYPRSFR